MHRLRSHRNYMLASRKKERNSLLARRHRRHTSSAGTADSHSLGGPTRQKGEEAPKQVQALPQAPWAGLVSAAGCRTHTPAGTGPRANVRLSLPGDGAGGRAGRSGVLPGSVWLRAGHWPNLLPDPGTCESFRPPLPFGHFKQSKQNSSVTTYTYRAQHNKFLVPAMASLLPANGNKTQHFFWTSVS